MFITKEPSPVCKKIDLLTNTNLNVLAVKLRESVQHVNELNQSWFMV